MELNDTKDIYTHVLNQSQEVKLDYYKPDVFDKEVAKILSKEFAKEFRKFLKHPQNTEAVITTPVSVFFSNMNLSPPKHQLLWASLIKINVWDSINSLNNIWRQRWIVVVKKGNSYSDGRLLYTTMVCIHRKQWIFLYFNSYIEFIDWKALGGEYLQANLYKVGIDTMNAINIISSKAA